MAVDEREAEEASLRDGEEWWDEGGDYEDDERRSKMERTWRG